jgi:hypothetical protein
MQNTLALPPYSRLKDRSSFVCGQNFRSCVVGLNACSTLHCAELYILIYCHVIECDNSFSLFLFSCLQYKPIKGPDRRETEQTNLLVLPLLPEDLGD